MDIVHISAVILWGCPLDFWVALGIIFLLFILKVAGAPKNTQEDIYYGIVAEAHNGVAPEIDETLDRLFQEAELMHEAGVTQ